MKDYQWTAVFLLGCALLLAGVAVVYWPAALILAGVAAIAMAVEANQ